MQMQGHLQRRQAENETVGRVPREEVTRMSGIVGLMVFGKSRARLAISMCGVPVDRLGMGKRCRCEKTKH